MASSAMRSITIARAPSSAALLSATPFSALMYFAASLSGSVLGCVHSVSASGSRPASIAIWPLVRRFGL
ncbi:Uncharacterised protein [Vibrio cholerae]|nr:Uncharacterised protein [Vibrio cholerae]